MKTELFMLPECTDQEKEFLSMTIQWYLWAFPKTHPDLGHLSMYRSLLEVLSWRFCHFVRKGSRKQKRQGFTLVLHEVYLLDFVLTLFLSAMQKPTKHGPVRKFALLSVKRARRQLRCTGAGRNIVSPGSIMTIEMIEEDLYDNHTREYEE